jgi:hypothetical protein
MAIVVMSSGAASAASEIGRSGAVVLMMASIARARAP